MVHQVPVASKHLIPRPEVCMRHRSSRVGSCGCWGSMLHNSHLQAHALKAERVEPVGYHLRVATVVVRVTSSMWTRSSRGMSLGTSWSSMVLASPALELLHGWQLSVLLPSCC